MVDGAQFTKEFNKEINESEMTTFREEPKFGTKKIFGEEDLPITELAREPQAVKDNTSLAVLLPSGSSGTHMQQLCTLLISLKLFS